MEPTSIIVYHIKWFLKNKDLNDGVGILLATPRGDAKIGILHKEHEITQNFDSSPKMS